MTTERHGGRGERGRTASVPPAGAPDEHPAEETLLALADGALPPAEAARVGGHVDACAACARALGQVRALDATFRAALARIDAAEPAAWRAGVAAPRRLALLRSGGASDRVADGTPARGERARGGGRRVALARWAAVALLSVVGVASAATLWRSRTGPRPAEARRETEGLAPGGRATWPAAVIIPVADSVVVVVDGAGAGSRVSLAVDAALVGEVRVEVAGAESPGFRPDDAAVSLALGGRVAAVRVAVPAGLRAARVDANGRVVARLARGAVTPAAARAGGVVVAW